MNVKDCELLDSTSRPGYRTYRTKSGFEFWARIKTEPDPPGTEYSTLSHEHLKTIGLLKGMKTKAFSELTEEEQKLFTEFEDDSIEE